jgi:tripartite-type tricarboxylate transporter receptor subunit TctC
MLSSLPLAQAGSIKALGLTGSRRAPAAPQIPTIAESGVQGFDFVSWYGLWGPKNLPANVSQVLEAHAGEVLALPGVRQHLNQLGFEPIGMPSDRFAAYISSEMAKAEKIITEANIKPE